MKWIGKNGNKLLRVLMNEIGVVSNELFSNLKEKNKIEGEFFEITLVEDTPGDDYLRCLGIGVEFYVYLDSIQFIALFLKEVIHRVFINGELDFTSILCRYFPIFDSLNSLDNEFFFKYIGGRRLCTIYQSDGEYIFIFIDSEHTVETDFCFPCPNNSDNYIKLKINAKGEPSDTLKIIGSDKKSMSTALMEFMKNEIYRKE